METTEEFEFIKQKAQEIQSSFELDGLWIGMTDAVNQGEWMWADPISKVAYSGWGPGEPEDRPGEDCAAIARHDGYNIDDYFCGRAKNHLICEIDLEDYPQVIG